jgi:hypothetical protein
MTGSCERPGCSEAAEVAYGFLTDPYVIWIDDLGAHERDHAVAGVLCRRHADSMVPPIGWALDDRRISAPRLFEPASAPKPPQRRPKSTPEVATATDAPDSSRRRKRRRTDETAELPLFATDQETGVVEPDPPTQPSADRREVAGGAQDAADPPDPPGPPSAEPWRPVFDGADDLDGLLDAKSPLLSRAFRAGTTASRRETTA